MPRTEGGEWDAFLLAAELVGGATLLDGPLLFLGGSTALAPYGNGCLVGDLSGLVVCRLPPVIRSRYSPGPDIAGLSDWERRISAIASTTSWQDLRLLSGMPSWMVILFERVAQARQETGRPIRTLRQCWPNLKVFIHGGVAFGPYLKVFEEWMGGPLPRIEVYPASEGFVAVQTEESGGLTLMLDYGIFYEFVPVEDLGRETPRRLTVATLEMNRPYAIVLTAPTGLWSYILGDTIRFVARDPLRLQIVGRIRHFVNAFGENVIVEEVEQALARACRLTQADVVEFTVAPRYPSQVEARGGHEWLIEFRRTPSDLADFGRLLDETLAELNNEYHTKRTGAVGMIAPQVTPLPPRTFYRWMREHGKLGDQHKVPRVTNDRSMAEALLAGATLEDYTPSRTGSRGGLTCGAVYAFRRPAGQRNARFRCAARRRSSMHTLGIILVVVSFAYGVILCRGAARTPRCRTCQIPTESISVTHDDHRFPVIETAYWCPRCARVVSRHFLTPHWE